MSIDEQKTVDTPKVTVSSVGKWLIQTTTLVQAIILKISKGFYFCQPAISLS